MTDIAVIVTCHEADLKYLPQAIDSINRQAPTPWEECNHILLRKWVIWSQRRDLLAQ